MENHRLRERDGRDTDVLPGSTEAIAHINVLQLRNCDEVPRPGRINSILLVAIDKEKGRNLLLATVGCIGDLRVGRDGSADDPNKRKLASIRVLDRLPDNSCERLLLTDRDLIVLRILCPSVGRRWEVPADRLQ